MTEPGPWGSSTPPPPQPWGSGTPPPPPYGQPWGAPPPPGYFPMYQPPRPTNTMAIVALVCAFTIPPLAIIFGHIALSQIRRNGEEGKGLAVAGLVIGYVVTGLILVYIVFMVILFVWSVNSINTITGSTYNSIWTTTTTSYPYESNEQAIKNARVGQCVHMEDNGSGNISTISRTDCKSAAATHRVTKVTTTISGCYDDWARSADKTVVLCLTKE